MAKGQKRVPVVASTIALTGSDNLVMLAHQSVANYQDARRRTRDASRAHKQSLVSLMPLDMSNPNHFMLFHAMHTCKQREDYCNSGDRYESYDAIESESGRRFHRNRRQKQEFWRYLQTQYGDDYSISAVVKRADADVDMEHDVNGIILPGVEQIVGMVIVDTALAGEEALSSDGPSYKMGSLEHLYIMPQYRGFKFGQSAAHEAESIMLARNCQMAKLDVGVRNGVAISVYEKAGWKGERIKYPMNARQDSSEIMGPIADLPLPDMAGYLTMKKPLRLSVAAPN